MKRKQNLNFTNAQKVEQTISQIEIFDGKIQWKIEVGDATGVIQVPGFQK